MTTVVELLKSRGTFVAGTFVGFGTEKNGYRSVYIRVDDRYAALAFDVKVGSDFDLTFAELEEGSFVIVKTSSPTIATSKAGNRYQRWFILEVFPED